MAGGIAGVLVAANPQNPGGSLAHAVWAVVGLSALAAWPAGAWRRGPSVPWGLRPAVSAGAAAVLLGLLAWFGAELAARGGQVDLADRVMGLAQAGWPLVVVLSCRLRQSRVRSQPPARMAWSGWLEAIIEASGIAPRIEALLPAGVRHRQLRVATLLLGMMLTLADRRPAHLTEVHAQLTALPGADQVRLGVTEQWKTGPHQLTYRQAERTFGLITAALEKQKPDGIPSAALTAVLDDLLEASIPAQYKNASTALAADWTDVESFSRPPPSGSRTCADPEASWGHRNSNLPGPKGEMFFGYYLSAATMVRDEDSPPIPELTRRITLSSCHADPVRALVPVLARMPEDGIALGDVLADSGYAHRDAGAWALPLRQAGAQLVCDLHPHDRGPQGTHAGAIIANGNLYCPPPRKNCCTWAR
jgi:hypothetical protein